MQLTSAQIAAASALTTSNPASVALITDLEVPLRTIFILSANFIVPVSIASCLIIAFNNEDFPEPLSPSKEIFCPRVKVSGVCCVRCLFQFVMTDWLFPQVFLSVL